MALKSLGLDAILLEAARLNSDIDNPNHAVELKALRERMSLLSHDLLLPLNMTYDNPYSTLEQVITLCRNFDAEWHKHSGDPEFRKSKHGKMFAFLAPTVPDEEFVIFYPEKLVESLLGKDQPPQIAETLRAALLARQTPFELQTLQGKIAARHAGALAGGVADFQRLTVLEGQKSIGQSLIRFINRGAEYIAGFFSGPEYVPHADKIALAKTSINGWQAEAERMNILLEAVLKAKGVTVPDAFLPAPALSFPYAAAPVGRTPRARISATTLRVAGLAASFMVVFTAYAGYKLKLGKLLQSSDNRPTAKAVEAPKAPANQAGQRPSSTTPSIPAKPAAPAPKANAAATPTLQAPANPVTRAGANSIGTRSFGQDPSSYNNTLVITPPATSGNSAPYTTPLTRPTSERGSN